jgi:predicted transcriptional regulator
VIRLAAYRFSGARVREQRQKRGHSREWLAVQLDRSLSTIRYYEVGFTTPPLPVIEQLADLFNVHPTEFFIDDNGAARNRKSARCIVDGCDRPVRARRRCSKHYQALRKAEAAKR